jgi:hypothetical protein
MMKKGEKSMYKKVVTKVWCGYSPEKRELLGKYVSPKSECSYFKKIPMELYREVTRLLPMKHRRIVFKAKSKAVRKELAETFAIYYSRPFLLSLGRPGAGMVTGGGPVSFS